MFQNISYYTYSHVKVLIRVFSDNPRSVDMFNRSNFGSQKKSPLFWYLMVSEDETSTLSLDLLQAIETVSKSRKPHEISHLTLQLNAM